MINTKMDVSLLIIGFDPYKDVWDVYFQLLEQYYPDRPKTFLATNGMRPQYPNVIVIPTSNECEWSMKVNKSLERIDSEYIVLLLEDFFTTRSVNNYELQELVRLMDNNSLNYCKLLNQSRIKGKKYLGKDYLRVIDTKDEYGISLQPAIWRKSFLKELIGEGNYNAWIFEFQQNKYKRHNQNRIDCIADKRNILQVTHAVVQSRYLRSAIRIFSKQGYTIKTTQRPMLSRRDNFKYWLKRFASEYTPKPFRMILKEAGRLLKISYVSDRTDIKDKQE